jgi:hypothetical protein
MQYFTRLSESAPQNSGQWIIWSILHLSGDGNGTLFIGKTMLIFWTCLMLGSHTPQYPGL